MSTNLPSIDISTMKLPDLFRAGEEVKTTNQPRVLQQDSEPVAVIMPTALPKTK